MIAAAVRRARPLTEEEKREIMGDSGQLRKVNIDDFAPLTEKRARKRPKVSKDARDRFASEADDFLREKQWTSFTAGHFVALYAACHERFYGVYPVELDRGEEFAVAKAAVGRLLAREFNNDSSLMVDFVRWTWVRAEKRRAFKGGNDGFRIGWRLQFSAGWVSDFRVDMMRARSK